MKFSKSVQIALFTVCCMSLLLVLSHHKRQKNKLSNLQLENINALTEGVESYKVRTCYKDVTFDDNSKYDITRCASNTTQTTVFKCSAGKTKKGYVASHITTPYKCIE